MGALGNQFKSLSTRLLLLVSILVLPPTTKILILPTPVRQLEEIGIRIGFNNKILVVPDLHNTERDELQ